MKAQERRKAHYHHRVEREQAPTLAAWRRERLSEPERGARAHVDCGWGRLIFGHTFDANPELIETLCEESPGKRDIAIYLADPHVVPAGPVSGTGHHGAKAQRS
jgi:hypothetical protein